MWVQVRTMDGKETHTVNSLSRLTKVEELRRKIQEVFHVEPGLQRLFYRGKQVSQPAGCLVAHLCSCWSRHPASAATSRYSLPLPWSRFTSPGRSLTETSDACEGKEQRPDSHVDTLGRQLALEFIASGLSNSSFL